MITTGYFLLILISVIACALVSGVFLTFSELVMQSMNGAKREAGIEVMQIVNRKVWKTVFIVLFLGTTALSPILASLAYAQLNGAPLALILLGSGIHFVGAFVVTMLFNVPMNNQLEAREFTGSDAAKYWSDTYMPRWTFWNYIRAISSGVAATCYLIASVIIAQGTTGVA